MLLDGRRYEEQISLVEARRAADAAPGERSLQAVGAGGRLHLVVDIIAAPGADVQVPRAAAGGERPSPNLLVAAGSTPDAVLGSRRTPPGPRISGTRVQPALCTLCAPPPDPVCA